MAWPAYLWTRVWTKSIHTRTIPNASFHTCKFKTIFYMYMYVHGVAFLLSHMYNLSSVYSRLLVENSEAHFRVIDTLLVKGSYSKRGGPPPIRRNLKPAHSESVCVCVCLCAC